jgi:hypothetical protein
MTLNSPRTKPQNYGFKKGDYHVVVNAATANAKIFSFEGKLLYTVPCLAMGQDPNWRLTGGDTPPSVYKLGAFYNDKENGTMERAYGWGFFDLVDLDNAGKEDGENTNQRAGIGLHAGGSSLPDPFARYQKLVPTLGCLRVHNYDLFNTFLPLYKKGAVFVSVHQDDK